MLATQNGRNTICLSIDFYVGHLRKQDGFPAIVLGFRSLGFSIIAGVDVARRALLPRPGFVAVPLTLQLVPAGTHFSSIRACSQGLCRRASRVIGFRFTAWTPANLSSRASQQTRPSSKRRLIVSEALLSAAGLILLGVALGRARVMRGPSDAERLMALQLLGTGGIAALLLIAYATNVPGVDDIALGFALLAAFATVAFVTLLEADEGGTEA
jgi:multicomponent Na+:H+ antiporter subunit F